MSLRIKWMLPVLMCVLLAPAFALAQDPAGGGGGGGGGDRGGDRQDRGGGGRQRMDPAQMREQMMNRFKEQMGVSDDEWKVIEPKLTKVIDAQRDSRANMGGFGGGGNRGGGNRGGDANQPQSAVAKAGQELRDVVMNKDAAAEEVTQKLKAFREARDHAMETLHASQKELKEVLTQRQEAALVMAGMLE